MSLEVSNMRTRPDELQQPAAEGLTLAQNEPTTELYQTAKLPTNPSQSQSCSLSPEQKRAVGVAHCHGIVEEKVKKGGLENTTEEELQEEVRTEALEDAKEAREEAEGLNQGAKAIREAVPDGVVNIQIPGLPSITLDANKIEEKADELEVKAESIEEFVGTEEQGPTTEYKDYIHQAHSHIQAGTFEEFSREIHEQTQEVLAGTVFADNYSSSNNQDPDVVRLANYLDSLERQEAQHPDEANYDFLVTEAAETTPLGISTTREALSETLDKFRVSSSGTDLGFISPAKVAELVRSGFITPEQIQELTTAANTSQEVRAALLAGQDDIENSRIA